MKRCTACGEEVENQFSFCPYDGRSLVTDLPTPEYHLTLFSDQSLPQRFAVEVKFLNERFWLGWPLFKADPRGFTSDQVRCLLLNLKQTITRPYFRAATVTAMSVVSIVIALAFVFGGSRKANSLGVDMDEEFGPVTTIDLNADENVKSKPGIGDNGKGRVGFNKGRGEGSNPTPARAQGGGGGGTQNPLVASRGRLAVPSEIPAPIPTTWARLPQSLPAAGINIDPVLYKDLPYRDYGDPRSKSVVPSNGPGTNGGVGTGDGTGVGEGTRSGVGPGRDGNMGGDKNNRGSGGPGRGTDGNNAEDDINRVFPPNELTTRARVLSKPEPQYSEEARREHITGTVILSVIFARTGQVTNIRTVQSLCCGLTEKAIAAARQIRFAPAARNGQLVSTRMQLEYNFNLY